MDFRKPEYRREVFLRFYEFHLRYRSHPGCVYQFIPFLSQKFHWTLDQRLWFATLNSLTQYPMTSLAIFNAFPEPPKEVSKFRDWFHSNWNRLPFDMDRRYQKKDVPDAVERYASKIKEYGSQKAFYTASTFSKLWLRVTTELHSLGRLGAWSGLEFVKIAAQDEIKIEFDTLMLDDLHGSKSHRNGLCIVLGREDLDWHSKLNTEFDGNYSPETLSWLKIEAQQLLKEARERFKTVSSVSLHHVGYETLESTLCCYKSWHRPNRRYPNVYSDMAFLRLRETAAKNPTLDLTLFWEAREQYLPQVLRLECNQLDPGLSSSKQNFYRETGQIPMMDLDWRCFENSGAWKRRSLI